MNELGALIALYMFVLLVGGLVGFGVYSLFFLVGWQEPGWFHYGFSAQKGLPVAFRITRFDIHGCDVRSLLPTEIRVREPDKH